MKIEDIKHNKIEFPRKDCVYMLVDQNDEIVYVGKSEGKLFARVAAHVYTKKFEKIAYIECKDKEEAMKKEAELIIEIQPKYNKCLDKPEALGYLGSTEFYRMAKEKYGMTPGQAMNKAMECGIRTVNVHSRKYFESENIEKIGV